MTVWKKRIVSDGSSFFRVFLKDIAGSKIADTSCLCMSAATEMMFASTFSDVIRCKSRAFHIALNPRYLFNPRLMPV